MAYKSYYPKFKEVERAYNNIVKEEKKKEKKAEKKKKDAPSSKKSKKTFLKNAKPIQVKWNGEPRIYGHTVLLRLQDHINANYFMVGEIRFLKIN